MDIRERKWKLMQRDLICIAFDTILCESLRDWQNQKLQNQRDELTKQIKEKWNVGIYTPEVQIKIGQMFENDPEHPFLKNLKKEDFLGPFKWWTITGEPHQAVKDARQDGTMIFKDRKIDKYSFKDNGLVHCQPHKIPIIIDPTVITMNDASKVKNEVWKIVENELKAKKQGRVFHRTKRGDKWNPTVSPEEPPELAELFHLREDTFKKYLEWYDMKRARLTFRQIAAIKKQGESTVRRGFDIIYKAIERTNPPAKERDMIVDTSPEVKKYDCPYHDDPSDCPKKNCAYLKRWMIDFNKAHKEIPLTDSLATMKYQDTFNTATFVKKKRKLQSPPKHSSR